MLTGIPLLHYFICDNEYTGAHFGMRYHLKPVKEKIKKEDGTEEKKQTLEGVIWPDPWAEEKTDPAERIHNTFPLTEKGRDDAIQWIAETFAAQEEKWKNCPGILDCEAWKPAPEPLESDAEKKE